MMASVETYLRQGQRLLRRWLRHPGFRQGLGFLIPAAGGFFLSGAQLRQTAMPLAMGLPLALPGWQGLAAALGSLLGYRCFWGQAGIPGTVWILGALALARLLPEPSNLWQQLLRMALAGFWVAATGLAFRLYLGDDTAFSVYVLRIAVAMGGCALLPHSLQRRDAISRWVLGGVAALTLAAVEPVPLLSLGYVAGAMAAVSGAFPAAALAGLGLDLARATELPMAAVLCSTYFARLIPLRSKWIRYGAPGAAALGVMLLCGIWDERVLPGLILGGALGTLLPARPELAHRQGETGLAQVRLEIAAGVLSQTQQLLLEVPGEQIDAEALLQRAIDRCCGSCSFRSSCTDRQRLTVDSLREPDAVQCRKAGRLRMELRQSRDQWKLLLADRQKQEQYRCAMIRQYQLLSDYLRALADRLPQRGQRLLARYRIEVSARSTSRERANGDACAAFSGSGCRYYVLLCDGMGTGLGAAEEAGSTLALVKKMLMAGLTAEQAFRSVNSLLVLRGQAGAVTLDLAEVRLDSGRVTLYKWGASPSWILGRSGIKQAGTATPPPGISVTEGRESVVRLSLGRGESLILISDGVELGEVLRRDGITPDTPPGELAERILRLGAASGEDDATAVVIRLKPGSLSP